MDPLYLDYAATTPVREEVRAAMEPYLCGVFGNPSSVHRWGRAAEDALEGARAEAAAALGARPTEIFFVRGGTESDNLAILGWVAARSSEDREPLLCISAVEHHAVLEAAESVEATGAARVVRLGVSADGALDLDEVARASRDGPALVSVMWVNNETGMVLPVVEVAESAAEGGATFHSDAAQALGKVPVDVRNVGLHLLSATGHKIYGPKGVGLLFVRQGTTVAPLLHGGGQERGLRPGTEDVAGAVGLAAAIRLAVEEREAEAERLQGLQALLETRLLAALDGLRVNAHEAARSPHVSSVGVDGIEDGQALLMALDLAGIGVSGGSACLSGAGRASHVMAELFGPDDTHAAVRFSFGRDTTEADVERAARETVRVVERLRSAA